MKLNAIIRVGSTSYEVSIPGINVSYAPYTSEVYFFYVGRDYHGVARTDVEVSPRW